MNSLSDPQAGFTGLVRRTATSALVGSALALFAGCASEPESHVVSAPPPASPLASGQPVVVQQQPTQVVVTPTANTSGGTLIVTQAPPPVQTEVMGAKPSSAHYWVPGYWNWSNNRYEWVSGHWEVPPRSDAVWIAPRTDRLSDGSYRFHEGYWQ